MNLKEMAEKLDVKAEYHALAEEFSVAEALILAGVENDMKQESSKSRLH